MELYSNIVAAALLIISYTTGFVGSHCLPEKVYHISCSNRTDEVSDKSGDAGSCSVPLTYEVLDRKAGLVAFSILLPVHEPNASTDVTILSLQSSGGVECSTAVEGVHSKFTLTVDGSGLQQPTMNDSNKIQCLHNQVKRVNWESNYMFTGCYRIDLSFNYDCKSKAFRIESDFVKDTFADLRLKLSPKLKGNNLTLTVVGDQLKNDCNNPLLSSPCLCLSLMNDGSSGLDSFSRMCELMVYANRPMEKSPKDGDYVSQCHWFKEDHGELVDCSCSWSEESLECLFIDVPPGYYSIELDIMDTRCNRGTIWTKSWDGVNEEPCMWKHEIFVKNNTGSLWPYNPSSSWSVSISWLVSLVALAAVVGCLSVYFWRRQRRRVLLTPKSGADTDLVDLNEKLLNPPKVLLLYARDCEPFMKAMAEIRRFLRENISARVYDVWEDTSQNQIDTIGDVWTSKYLYAKDVRVVVFATPISRRIEDAIMNGLEINYAVPNSRDETFLFAFKTAISLAPKTNESCNKFIVVRLHHQNCSKDILQNFSTNSTIYTLPIHLQKLTFHLIQSQSVHVVLGFKDTQSLSDKLQVYEKFVLTHPGYVDGMLDFSPNSRRPTPN